jgi:hypothetical protein
MRQERFSYRYVCYTALMGKRKNPGAVSLGRKGGKKRAATLSGKELKESARIAIMARWEKYYQDHPEKLKAREEREAKRKKQPAAKRASKRKGS